MSINAGLLTSVPRALVRNPGPVCFRRGGEEATVTDCQLLLGRLDAKRFLGSRMPLDGQAAARAIRNRLAAPTGMTVEAAAATVVWIAEANMANAIRRLTVQRGLDPREFTLFAYGRCRRSFRSSHRERTRSA